MNASRKRWLGAAALALVVPTGWALVRSVSSLLSSDDVTTFHGVRLGMPLSDVRARFDIPGTWQVRPEESLVAAEWAPRTTATVRSVRFEFHQGLLVAVRAVVAAQDSSATGERIHVTPGTVVERRPIPGGDVRVTLIARSCPVHAPEVRRLIESH